MKFNGSYSLLGGLPSILKKKMTKRTQHKVLKCVTWGEVKYYLMKVSFHLYTCGWVCVCLGRNGSGSGFQSNKFKITELQTPMRVLLVSTTSIFFFLHPRNRCISANHCIMYFYHIHIVFLYVGTRLCFLKDKTLKKVKIQILFKLW